MPNKRDEEVDEEELFPELDLHDPTHKAIHNAARRYYKDNADRSHLLRDSKAKVDAARERLLKLMHEAKLDRFRFRGLVVEVIKSEEKVDVQLDENVEADE